MEEKKKGNSGLIILVVILLVACVGMGCFIFINKDKLMSKENNETIEKTEKDINENKDLDINDTLVETLYKMTRSDLDKCEYETQPLLIENVGDKLTLDNMNDNYKGIIIYDYVEKNKEISEEEMKKAYEKIFGPNTYKVMNKINFNAVGNINYDSANKKYILDFNPNEPWGCVTHLYNKEKVINATKNDDTIKITTAYIFNCSFSTELCKDSKGNEKMEQTMSISEDSNKILDFIEEHKNELHQLTYTFKKAEDGNYYYSEVERTK